MRWKTGADDTSLCLVMKKLLRINNLGNFLQDFSQFQLT